MSVEIKIKGAERAIIPGSANQSVGTRTIIGHHDGEAIMNKLTDVAITSMHPVVFYYNLLGFIPVIKKEGIIKANYGAEEILV